MQLRDLCGKSLRAGRLGIQPSFPESDLATRIIPIQFHIGHAGTLVAASRICAELDIPLWIRFKWRPEALLQNLEAASPDVTTRKTLLRYETLAVSMCQTADCASWLGIEVERFYVPPAARLMPPVWADRISRIVRDVTDPITASPDGGWPTDDRAQWYDDAVVNGNCLHIRGEDWNPETCGVDTKEYLTLEDRVYEAAGNEKFQVTLPALMVGNKKMSTSLGNAVSWEALKVLGRDRAREWLMERIDLNNLPGESTQWSWDEWVTAIGGDS